MTSPHLFRRLTAAFFISVIGCAAPALAQVDTAAKQALLVDYGTGAVLLEKNADELMPPSSMSKLMTTYMVFDRLKNGSLSLDDTLPVSENAWRKQGSKMFVHVGDRVKIQDLLRGIIVQSGNDACIVVAEGLGGSEESFAAEMTRKSRDLGLTASVFKNATGWPDEGHLMTARDLSVLAKRLIADFPEYYRIYSELNFSYSGITQGNRNPLLYKNMGADGLKTGHTEAAGYGLTGSAQRGERRLILVINGLSSMKERAEETERLIEWGFREYDNYALFKGGEVVADAEVWLGDAPSVPLIAGQKLEVTLPRKVRRDMKVVAQFNGPVPAPVKKGAVIGQLVVSAPGMKPVELPLLAGADVERLGFLGRIQSALKHILWGAS